MVVGRYGDKVEAAELQVCLSSSTSLSRLSRKHLRKAHTCHLRQPGLKLGLPSRASSAPAKTYSACCCRCCGARHGRPFSSYVTSGNVSKTRFTGAGTANHDLGCCCCAKSLSLELSLFFAPSWSTVGIVGCHMSARCAGCRKMNLPGDTLGLYERRHGQKCTQQGSVIN